MYKIFDTPKNKYDIVNKDYIDKILINSGSYLQNLNIEIHDHNWTKDDENNTYYFKLEHSLESINLIINCYNAQNEISNIYYKIIDKNTILFVSNINEYIRIVINYSTNIQTVPENLLDIIHTLQKKIIELEDRIIVLENSTIKIKNIKINGPDIIYLESTDESDIIKVQSIMIHGPNIIY